MGLGLVPGLWLRMGHCEVNMSCHMSWLGMVVHGMVMWHMSRLVMVVVLGFGSRLGVSGFGSGH